MSETFTDTAVGAILNVLGDKSDSLSYYTETQMAGNATTVAAAKIATQTLSVAGNQVDISSNTHYEEAKTFRYNAAVYWDLYAPQVTINSDQTVLQAKTLNIQAFHQQTSCVNNWIRAQNINTVQAESHYDFSTNEHFIGAPNLVIHSGSYLTYGDTIKIQAGNPNKQKVSDKSDGSRYGDFQIGAVNNVAITAMNGGVATFSNTFANTFAKDILLESQNKAVIRSKNGIGVKSLGEVSLLSGRQIVLASAAGIRLNTAGSLSLAATRVDMGLGGAMSAINLDILDLAEELVESVAGSSLVVPTNLINSAAFIQGLPAVSQFTNFTNVIGNFNAFTPDSVMSFVGGLSDDDFMSAVGGIAQGTITNVAKKYTGIASQAIGLPGLSGLVDSVIPQTPLTPIQSLFDPEKGITFKFSQYPKLEGLENYLTAPVDEPKSYVDAANSIYAPFPTFHLE